MRVKSIYLENVRGLPTIALDFLDPVTEQIRPRTVIAGSNGTGKTTIAALIIRYLIEEHFLKPLQEESAAPGWHPLELGQGDDETRARTLAKKIVGMRIFPDAEEKMNLSLADVGGGLLVISQFTLLADLRRGRRPFFGGAEAPERAAQDPRARE